MSTRLFRFGFKPLTAMLATMLVAVILAACGDNSATPAPAATTAAATTAASSQTTAAATSAAATTAAATAATGGSKNPVTITYFTFSAAPDHLKDLDAMIKAFQAQNPEITVKVETAPYDNYFTKLQTLVAGNTAPDVFELNYENFISYASKGVLKDLSPLISADKTFDAGVFYPKAYQAFQRDGKQYGLAESFSDVVLYYNKDLFDKAGVSYPNESWTWKEELDAAKKLTDSKAGVWGSYQPLQFFEFYKVIAQNGGAMFDSTGKPTINTPQNVEALKWLVDKTNTYKISPTDADLGGQADADTALFKAGKIAMLRTGIWNFAALKDAPFKWDIALEPGNTTKAHQFFANAVVVSNKSDKADAAWKWARFFTSSPEAAKLRVAASWELPALTNQALFDDYLKITPPASRQIVFKALETAVTPPVIEKQSEMQDMVTKELTKAKLGQETPQQALDNLQTQITKLVQK
ncbi:MAG TPA: sugar ABC transporter substrate-binding protein [Chloroflexia bacterium]|nr:sugar ABC transporter substrate-binding protein [Chloroflexia bacterium]